MKIEPAWWANIYVGTYDKDEGLNINIDELKWVCQDYCDEIGYCVSFTPTNFIYSHGDEPGVIVGCIQYPRFPKTNEENRRRALVLSEKLMKKANQCRVTIMMPDDVIMLTKEGYENT